MALLWKKAGPDLYTAGRFAVLRGVDGWAAIERIDGAEHVVRSGLSKLSTAKQACALQAGIAMQTELRKAVTRLAELAARMEAYDAPTDDFPITRTEAKRVAVDIRRVLRATRG